MAGFFGAISGALGLGNDKERRSAEARVRTTLVRAVGRAVRDIRKTWEANTMPTHGGGTEESPTPGSIGRNNLNDSMFMLDESSPHAARLCAALEACMFHGLHLLRTSQSSTSRSTSSAPDPPHFWDFVESLQVVNSMAFAPSITMARMQSSINTPCGLCRVWLRLLLNQNALHFNLQALHESCSPATDASHQWYEDSALVRDSRAFGDVVHLCASLDGIGFELHVNDARLNLPPKKALQLIRSAATPLEIPSAKDQAKYKQQQAREQQRRHRKAQQHKQQHQSMETRKAGKGAVGRLVVSGAGIGAVNGVYEPSGERDGVLRFEQLQLHSSKHERHEIFRASSSSYAHPRWFIGNPRKRVVYYFASNGKPIPPTSGSSSTSGSRKIVFSDAGLSFSFSFFCVSVPSDVELV